MLDNFGFENGLTGWTVAYTAPDADHRLTTFLDEYWDPELEPHPPWWIPRFEPYAGSAVCLGMHTHDAGLTISDQRTTATMRSDPFEVDGSEGAPPVTFACVSGYFQAQAWYTGSGYENTLAVAYIPSYEIIVDVEYYSDLDGLSFISSRNLLTTSDNTGRYRPTSQQMTPPVGTNTARFSVSVNVLGILWSDVQEWRAAEGWVLEGWQHGICLDEFYAGYEYAPRRGAFRIKMPEIGGNPSYWRTISELASPPELGSQEILKLKTDTGWAAHCGSVGTVPLSLDTGFSWETVLYMFPALLWEHTAENNVDGTLVTSVNSALCGHPFHTSSEHIYYTTDQVYEGLMGLRVRCSDLFGTSLAWRYDRDIGNWPAENAIRCYLYFPTEFPVGTERAIPMGFAIGVHAPTFDFAWYENWFGFTGDRYPIIYNYGWLTETEPLPDVVGTTQAPIGAWFRVEAHHSPFVVGEDGRSLVTDIEMRIFLDPSSSEPSETLVLPNRDTRESIYDPAGPNGVWFGASTTLYPTPPDASPYIYYMDNLACSTGGWCGP